MANTTLCMTAMLCAVLAAGSAPQNATAPRNTPPTPKPLTPLAVRDRLGVAHVKGRYHFSNGDFLNEGADRVLELGSRVLKVWFMARPERDYPFNSRWPKVKSLVELAETPYYRALFAKPFTTFILETYSFGRDDHYWRRGITPAEMEDETRQFQELTAYLLKTYRGQNKTFVLQNWEGDWGIRSGFDADEVPTPVAIEGMIAWLNARQKGVERARSTSFARGVQVFHAAEVNRVADAMDGKTSVTNDVLPHTRCDLYSYSAYDTAIEGKRFRAALDYIAAKAPDSKTFGARNVFIGEFGVPENEFGSGFATASVQKTIREALAWGCPYVVYWQIFDNECKVGKSDEKGDCRGFWLIKPSGKKSVLWHTLRAFLTPS